MTIKKGFSLIRTWLRQNLAAIAVRTSRSENLVNDQGFSLRRTLRSKNLVSENGFSLIELLVVLSIIGIVIGLTAFGLGGMRKNARDTTRKADLETIRAGIEIYKSDCDQYPASLPDPGDPLVGDDVSSSSCLSGNIYLSAMPGDLLEPDRSYFYSTTGVTYELCAAMEGDSTDAGCSGSCGETCSYQTTNP